MVVIIRKLIWRLENIRHITEHDVSPEEVEEMRENFHIEKVAYRNRVILLGETDSGRILEVVLEPKGKGRFYPVTAYDPHKRERSLFRNKKAVEGARQRKKGGGNK